MNTSLSNDELTDLIVKTYSEDKFEELFKIIRDNNLFFNSENTDTIASSTNSELFYIGEPMRIIETFYNYWLKHNLEYEERIEQ